MDLAEKEMVCASSRTRFWVFNLEGETGWRAWIQSSDPHGVV